MSLWKLLFGTRVKKGRVDYETIRLIETKWPAITQNLLLGKPSNLKEAVIEADKLTDAVLRKLYPETETMGERLKLAKERFLNKRNLYDDLWYAHKIRNEIVHNPNFNLPSGEVVSIIEKFKTGINELGVRV